MSTSNRRCAVMQPTFLPWAGYFELISAVDVFVFLDDVQFEKQSWQSRNRILIGGRPHWVTVPVHASLDQTIREIETDESRHWRKKLLRTLEQAYARSPVRQAMLDLVREELALAGTSLAELNIRLILAVATRLELEPLFMRASELEIAGSRSERLVRICEHFGCDEYVSPVGAADYLASDGCFESSRVKLSFQDYHPQPYSQPGASEFVSHLSWVDVVANLGWERAAEYIRHGRQVLCSTV